MNEEEKYFRIKFNKSLEPIKVMLVHRQGQLSHVDWLNFVEQTRLSIIGHPEEYLGQDLPKTSAVESVVDTIFNEFVKAEE